MLSLTRPIQKDGADVADAATAVSVASAGLEYCAHCHVEQSELGAQVYRFCR